jgi:hypothetical protein
VKVAAIISGRALVTIYRFGGLRKTGGPEAVRAHTAAGKIGRCKKIVRRFASQRGGHGRGLAERRRNKKTPVEPGFWPRKSGKY